MTALATPLPAFVPDQRYSVTEWLAIEEASGERYEYHDGRLVSARAMAGGSWQHALLIANVSGVAFRELTPGAGEEPRCNTYSSDLRLAVASQRRYFYPDVAVVCGAPTFDPLVPTAVNNPLVVFEVLSPSSMGFDGGEKFDHYATLPTLRDYVLLSQDRRRVEVRSRVNARAPWVYQIETDVNASAALPSLGTAFPVGDVYRGWGGG